MNKHFNHWFGALGVVVGAVALVSLAFSQDKAIQDKPPTIPPAQTTPIVAIGKSPQGEFYEPERTLGVASVGGFIYRFLKREVPSPFPLQKASSLGPQRLVVFEVEKQVSRQGTSPSAPRVIWRYSTVYETGVLPWPSYDGDIIAAPDGQLMLMISNLSYSSPGVYFLRVSNNNMLPSPVPYYTHGGNQVTDGKKILTDARYQHPGFLFWRYANMGVSGYALESVNRRAIVVRVELDKSWPKNSKRFRYDLQQKKWSEIKATQAELVAREKRTNRERWMEEYRRRRETFGQNKQQAIANVRRQSGIKDWTPLPAAWDTPNLKAKSYWLTPSPVPTPSPVSTVQQSP